MQHPKKARLSWILVLVLLSLGFLEDYLLKRNQNPKPYRWHAKGHEILAKLEHARKAAAAVSN